ncbi:MAG: ABC transporter ATP-binding protein [Deltaproteobacteria bacterium]|nr:ABC transporter ATP-binding protein [Deltaproteobacteria bacterium]
MKEEIIKTDGLTKIYGRHVAVDNLSFEVNEGEIFGFLGPNGSGKTTTILILLGLTYPTKGDAIVCGFNPIREAVKIKRIVGYLPEHVGFYDDMTARENLKFTARLNRIPEEESDKKIEELLEIVGLSEFSDKKVGTYSRGMRQRLGIAEVLIKDPKLVVLDEPTLGLDLEGSIQLIELIKNLSKEKGITVLFSSHHLNEVQRIADRIGIMIQGKMVAKGPIETLAKEKLGVDKGEYTLEELYLKYFQEG